jgi:SAM-dependent methyltransferase
MKQVIGKPLDRHALDQWQQSPRAQRLIAQEVREVSRVLPDLFGRHLLQIGSWCESGELLAASEMLHRAVLGTVPGSDAQALIEAERLPLPNKSVDAVLLAHALEFARSPQSVLREVNRVLTERGRLLILGFNPWSVWGLRQRLGLRYRAFPTGARFVRAGRLHDWLELLDFQVTEIRRFAVGSTFPPVHSDGESFSPATLIAPMAGAYLLVAKKRVIPMTLMGRPARSIVRPLIGTAALPGAHSTQTRDGESG